MSKRPWKITQSFKKNKFKLRKFNEPLTPIKRNKNWSSYQFEPYKENLINHQISEFPPSEKDKQILDLEKRLKEMEEKINEHKQPFVTDNKQSKSNGYDNEYNDTTAKTNGTSVFKKTK